MTIAVGYIPTIVVGDGTSSAIGTVFPFYDGTDLIVTQRTIATGAEVLMTDPTNYSVTGGGATPATGNVTPADGATDFPDTVHWVIQRSTPITQSTDWENADNFPAVSHENAADRLTLIAQELKAEINRCYKVPISDALAIDTDLPSHIDRASTAMTFDANGDVTVT